MSGLGYARSDTVVDAAWRIAFRLGFPLARIWWRLRRPHHEGALVAIYVGKTLSLVRSSYRLGDRPKHGGANFDAWKTGGGNGMAGDDRAEQR